MLKNMMHFSFRHTSLADIDFYTECFYNDEFQYMLYHNDPINVNNLERYIANNGKDIQFIGSIMDEDGFLKDVGFAHFYYKEENAYTYVGGVHPKYFNHGYGVYASIAMLSLIYDLMPNIKISTGIYKYNRRSLKADLAIGFTITRETDEKWLLELTKEGFNNDFVHRVKLKMKYQLSKTQ